MGPGGGGAQPDEGQHCGDDEVILGVALLLVQVQVGVEDVQRQTVKKKLSLSHLTSGNHNTHVAEL